MSTRYTQAQKLAYYKKKANAVTGRGAYRRTRTVRKRRVVAGRGAYRKRVVRGRGAYGVSDLMKGRDYKPKSFIGSGAGHLGDFVSGIFGLGEYKVEKNVLMQDPPTVHNINDRGGVVVRHREFLGDIITSSTAGAFSLQSFSINPGAEQTFPWLSQVAANYEQYEIQGMLFEYRTMSSDALNSTNTALGSVIMATDYNAANPSFAQKAEMENYEYGMSCKPSCSMIHPIECARRQTVLSDLYVRTGAVPEGQDVRLYDLGNFQIATTGFQAANVNIGELWVTYQVAFLKTKMWTSLGNYNSCAAYSNVLTNWNSASNFWGITAATPGGFNLNANSIPITIGGTSTGTVTFPPSQLIQTYFYQMYVVNQTGGMTGGISPTYINLTVNSGAAKLFPIGPWPSTSIATNNYCYTAVIQTVGGGAAGIITFTSTLTPSTGQTGGLGFSIVQVPNEFAGTAPYIQ